MNINDAAFLIHHHTGQREVFAAELLIDEEIVGILQQALRDGEKIEVMGKAEVAEIWRSKCPTIT